MKSDELKEAMKESPRRYTNPFLSDEENEQVDFWNNQELEHSNIKDDLTNNCEDEKFRKSLEQSNVPSDFFKKETELYTDKNVMECELPEFVVCYKESGFHVKDICVDEGIPHGERIFFNQDNHEILCVPSPANEGKNGDKIEDSLHTRFLKPELLGFPPMEDYYVESVLCSGTNGKVDTDLPVLELTNNQLDIGDNCNEVMERNLDIQLLNSERISSSREDFCTKSDASSGTKQVGTDSALTMPTYDHRNMGNISINTEITDQDLQNSIPDKDYKDLEDADTKECGTKEEVVDSAVPNELKNVSKDDNDNEDGPSKCAPDKLKFSPVSDTVPKATDNHVPDMPMQAGDEQINSSASLLDTASREQVASNSTSSLQQDRPLPSLKSLLESVNGAHDIDQQPSQVLVEEISKSPVVGYEADELGISVQTTIISNESTMEGSNTSNLNNGKSATNSGIHGVENPENVDKHSIEAKGAPNHQDVALNNVAMVNPVQRGEGESSFSVAGPISGLITYSGPIAFSGSASLRSDSSTTSTRSFAFPILQTEWNSSPVRMAKADRRRLPKPRGWRHGLLCCRF